MSAVELATKLAFVLAFAFPQIAGATDSINFAFQEQTQEEKSEHIDLVSFRDSQIAQTFRSEYLSRPARLLFGTEFTYLDFSARSGGQATLTLDDSGTAGVDASFRDANGVDDTGFAPRIWLGVQLFDRWSVVGRYWNLTDSTSGSPDLEPGTSLGTNFATFLDESQAEAFTADIELMRSLTFYKWKIDGIVGARRAKLDVDSKLTAFGVFTTGNFINLAFSNGSSFEGSGVTYAMAARRQILDSHTYLFMSFRGSDLAGENDSFGRAVGSVASAPNAPLVGAATVRRSDAAADMDIFEYQIGLEWNYNLKCRPANLFLRTAYEFQDWNIDGPATGGAGFGGTLGTLQTNGFSSARIADLQLKGLSVSTGLTW